MAKLLVMLLTLIAMTGCSPLGVKHVFFGDRIQSAAVPNSPDFNLYFDRAGNLYPDRTVRVSDEAMKLDLTLDIYFSRPTPHCAAANRVALSTKLCSLPAITDARKRRLVWQEIQDEWAATAAARLAAATRQQNASLFMLIHGFRVGQADEIYKQASQLVDRHRTQDNKLIFVKVHWDGLTSPTPLGAWGKAQVNGFLVGLSLRRVLADIAPTTPLKVLTHSSGAFVLAATLGDPGAAFEEHILASDGFSEFLSHSAGSARFPLPKSADIRAALIVPATPASTYVGGIDANSQVHPGILTPAKLIIGLNEKDFGVSKGPVHGGWSVFGSTELGQSMNGFCTLKKGLANRVNGKKMPAPALVDFEGTPDKTSYLLLWESHNWENYLKRAKMATVLELLFAADSSGAGEPHECREK